MDDYQGDKNIKKESAMDGSSAGARIADASSILDVSQTIQQLLAMSSIAGSAILSPMQLLSASASSGAGTSQLSLPWIMPHHYQQMMVLQQGLTQPFLMSDVIDDNKDGHVIVMPTVDQGNQYNNVSAVSSPADASTAQQNAANASDAASRLLNYHIAAAAAAQKPAIKENVTAAQMVAAGGGTSQKGAPVRHGQAQPDTAKMPRPRPPKKPLTPYMLFSKEMWHQVKAANSHLSLVTEIGAIIGSMWRELDASKKERYNELFSRDKIRYDEEIRLYLKNNNMHPSDLIRARLSKKKDSKIVNQHRPQVTPHASTILNPPEGPNKKGSKGNSKDVSRRSSTNGGANARGSHATVSRIMSANRLRIQELRNRVTELTDQCVILQQENRDFKRQLLKQERKLNGYEQQENGMPQIMQRQADETQMLRDQLRQQKERCDKKSKKLKDKEDELEAMRRLVKKMQGLVEDKKLMERKKLSAKLKETEDKLHKEEEKNQTLERHVQNLTKNHKHQLVTERTKEQELERQIEKLQEKYDKLEIDMKEKEKERTLQNIYSLRSMRPPHRLESSLHSSSQSDLARTSKPRPDGRERARVDRRRVGGSGDLTGRTADYSPKKSERKYEDSSIHLNHGDEYSYRESQTSVYKAEDQRHKEKDTPRDKERDKEEDTAKGRLRENEDPLLWLREERIREQELERRKWLEVKEKEDAKKEEEERRREEARRREEERQREQAEEERRKEAEQKRRMEQYQQPNLHQDQNHFDDRNNKKNDPEVLRKAQKEEEEERLAKEALLAKLRAIDEGKHDVRLSSPTRKEYNFTEPVNNLHQGLPAHGQRKSNIFGDGDSPTFGSYQPSFVPRDTKMVNRRDSKTSSKPAVGNKNEKSDLFAELLGTEPKRASNVLTDARQDSPVLLELGGSTTKAKQYPTQLHREKQAVGPVFRSTAKKIEFSDEEIEEIEELTIK